MHRKNRGTERGNGIDNIPDPDEPTWKNRITHRSKPASKTAKVPTMHTQHVSNSWRPNVNRATPVVASAHMKSARGRLRTMAKGCRPKVSCVAFCRYAFYKMAEWALLIDWVNMIGTLTASDAWLLQCGWCTRIDVTLTSTVLMDSNNDMTPVKSPVTSGSCAIQPPLEGLEWKWKINTVSMLQIMSMIFIDLTNNNSQKENQGLHQMLI